MTESAETEVLTPAPRPGILGTLSNQIAAEYGLCTVCLSPSSHHQMIPRHGKGCLLAWVDTWHDVTRDSSVTSQHVTPECHTRDRNNPEQLSGCYRVLPGVMTCDCIFRLRLVTRSDTPAQAVVCGVCWHVSRGRTLTITELSSGICHRVLWSIFWLELYKGIRLVTT